MKPIRIVTLLAVLLLCAAPAVADRVVLKNGRELTGRIVSETSQQLVIDIGDGMKMTLRRAIIESIERTPEPESAPESTPDPTPAPEPDRVDDPSPAPLPTSPAPRATRQADFFGRTPDVAWGTDFGRTPELFAAKVTGYRAYELVDEAPLVAVGNDEKTRSAIRRHGHGGVLTHYRFRYVGIRELRYGHRVKFVGEITAPPAGDPDLITLERGPVTSTTRLVVILVKSGKTVERYATTTVFTNRDFRVKTIDALQDAPAPVRTYSADHSALGTAWIVPKQTGFLDGLFSAFGNTPRTRIARYRFRVAWFGTPPARRPGLDPVLLRRNVAEPLAADGVAPASPDLIAKHWGDAKVARKNLEKELAGLRRTLATIGVVPGHGFYVEEDRIGLLGDRGVTIETRRYSFTKKELEALLRP